MPIEGYSSGQVFIFLQFVIVLLCVNEITDLLTFKSKKRGAFISKYKVMGYDFMWEYISQFTRYKSHGGQVTCALRTLFL